MKHSPKGHPNLWSAAKNHPSVLEEITRMVLYHGAAFIGKDLAVHWHSISNGVFMCWELKSRQEPWREGGEDTTEWCQVYSLTPTPVKHGATRPCWLLIFSQPCCWTAARPRANCFAFSLPTCKARGKDIHVPRRARWGSRWAYSTKAHPTSSLAAAVGLWPKQSIQRPSLSIPSQTHLIEKPTVLLRC